MPNLRILIVEDEVNIARTIEATFSSTGHTIEICYDGESAVEKLKASAYDIMFLDIRLPGLNGMEILKMVYEQKIPVQVVMITAYGSIDFAVQAMKYGAVDFIQKPFEPDALRNIVQAISQRKALDDSQANEYTELLELYRKHISERDYHKAHAAIKRAIAAKPESAEAYNLLGAVIEIMGDELSAVQAYQMALKFDKAYKPALDNIKRITSLESNTVGLTDLMSSLKKD